MAEAQRVGLVLAGGGARGAYEAGALSVLLPVLEARGERPRTMVGTSVGAINAVHVGSTAHLPAGEAVASGLERWRMVDEGRVVRPVVLEAPLVAARYLGEILSVPGVRLSSLLNPSPLADNLRSWIDWNALHRNIATGTVEQTAVVATASRTGRSVGFIEGHIRSLQHTSHVIDYVAAKLDHTHVRASAAIPILFPPVRVEEPEAARGWYVDGGTRLNTPIKPALDLAVDKLVVIATDAVAELPKTAGRHESGPPDLGDGALQILQGALVDPLIEDMRILGAINMFFAGHEHAPSAQAYRAARGKPPYRQVPYIFIAPAERGAIGKLAAEVFRKRYGGLRAFRSPNLALMSRLLGRESTNHGELLSYLFFDRDFMEGLMEMGAADARRWLDAEPGPDEPWQVEPLDAFTRHSADGAAPAGKRAKAQDARAS
jgi:NTE family protein